MKHSLSGPPANFARTIRHRKLPTVKIEENLDGTQVSVPELNQTIQLNHTVAPLFPKAYQYGEDIK